MTDEELIAQLQQVPETTALTLLWGLDYWRLAGLARSIKIHPLPRRKSIKQAIIDATRPAGQPAAEPASSEPLAQQQLLF